MNLSQYGVNELINIAKSTSDVDEIYFLAKSPFMLVRRCIAKNNRTPQEIINKLSTDPVLNVSYIATLNPICSVKRVFEDIPCCVSCEESELDLDCINCQKT